MLPTQNEINEALLTLQGDAFKMWVIAHMENTDKMTPSRFKRFDISKTTFYRYKDTVMELIAKHRDGSSVVDTPTTVTFAPIDTPDTYLVLNHDGTPMLWEGNTFPSTVWERYLAFNDRFATDATDVYTISHYWGDDPQLVLDCVVRFFEAQGLEAQELEDAKDKVWKRYEADKNQQTLYVEGSWLIAKRQGRVRERKEG